MKSICRSGLLALASVVLSACSSIRVAGVLEEAPPVFAEARPQTLPVALLADTQFHESRGEPSRFFGKSGDEFVPVTVRTGQQVIGTGDMLLRALAMARDHALVLHAGDALDVSCQTEWAQFAGVMTEGRGDPGPASWLFAPGNHDGFMVGNFLTPERGAYRTDYWRNVCNAGRVFENGRVVHGHLPKNDLIRAYTKQLARTVAGADQSDSGCTTGGEYCWSYLTMPPAREWQSYIVQLVRMPAAPGAVHPVYALLLDSSEFREPPVTPWTWAGLSGNVSTYQMQAAEQMIRGLPAEARFFIVAHHPLKDWQFRYWDYSHETAWRRLVGDPRSLRFAITAHSHDGGWYRHPMKGGDLMELNIGSLNDWPVYFRSLSFGLDAQGRMGVTSRPMDLPIAATCGPLPAPGSGYSVQEQSPLSYRAAEEGLRRWLTAFSSAWENARQFEEAKHKELDPQVLAYADIVQATMPADAAFSYLPYGTSTRQADGSPVRQAYTGGAAVAQAMRDQVRQCKDREKLCSLQAKEHLLMAVERYYWSPETPAAIREQAHEMRLCGALQASRESARQLKSDWEFAESVVRRTRWDSILLPAAK